MGVIGRIVCLGVLLLAGTLPGRPVWETGAYAPASWTPLAGENLLAGRAAAMTGTYHSESGRCVNGAPLTLLTDGGVPGDELDWSKVVGLKDGVTLAWTFEEPKVLNRLRLCTRWADRGRDGIGVDAVQVKYAGSDVWTPLVDVPAVSYAVERDNVVTLGTGALYATLQDADGALAAGIVALKLVLGLQDNGGAGYVEIEATGFSAPEDPQVDVTLAGGDATSATVCGDVRWCGLGAETTDLYIAFGRVGALAPPVRFAEGLHAPARACFRVEGLSPATQYAYSVFASNALGRVTARWEGAFTTLAAPAEPVIVNEISAADDVDWIELFNPNDLPVDLTGWLLTDDPTKARSKWRALAEGTSVPAHGYLVVIADGQTSLLDNQAHVDLGLSASGETVALARPDGTIVSQLAFPEQIAGVTYGLAAEGALRYFPVPTPGAANGSGRNGPTPVPTFSAPRGYKTAAFDLTLSCPEMPNAPIHYTTDGTAPTAASPRYAAPLRIASTTVVRAAAIDPLSIQQREGVATYIFLDEVLSRPASTASPRGGFPASGAVNGQAMRYGMRADLLADPVARAKILRGFTNTIATIAITIDPANLFNAATGIYVNCTQRGETWERTGLVEQIDPVHGATNEFAAPMGLRIRGAASRTANYPKHSFRLFFRGEYGRKTVDFPFFGDEGASSFRRMDLRCSQNYSWANSPFEGSYGWIRDTFIAETFERDSQRDLGEPYTRSRYCNLFINGEYWGLYQTQERVDEHYAETYLGGDASDYDTYNVNELNSGTDTARQALYAMCTAGFVDNAAYLRACGRNPDGTRNPDFPVYVDVTNLIARTLVGHYAADGDSPCSIWSRRPNNYFALNDHTANGTGFKWFCHDGEHGLGMGEYYRLRDGITANPVQWGLYSGLNNFNSHLLNHLLMSNAEYRVVWGDLVRRHLFPGGALSAARNEARFRARMAEIDDAIVCEAARWGRNGENYTTWTNACDYIVKNFFGTRFEELLDFYRAEGWYPSVAAPTIELDAEGTSACLASEEEGATILYTLDGTDPRLFGGATNVAAVLSAGPIPVPPEGLSIRARAVSANGAWSALAEFEASSVTATRLRAERIAVASDEGTIDTVRVTPENVTREGRLCAVWGAVDHGAELSAWPYAASLGVVTPTTGAVRVGRPAGFDPASPSCAVLRFFLMADEISPGVTMLDSISGDGTQRIDLDYVPTALTRCQIRFSCAVGKGGAFVGTDKGNDVQDWRFFSNKDKSAGGLSYFDLPQGRRLSGMFVADATRVYHFELGNCYVTDLATDTVLARDEATTFPDGYDWPLYLFSLASAGSHSYGTVSALKFFEGDELTRDYLPARDANGVVCLYERVAGRCLYPAGGALTGGAATGTTAPVTNFVRLAVSAPLSLAGADWRAGGVEMFGRVQTSLRVAEVMSVPVLGGSDGEEYIVLTNLDASAALDASGVRVTCTKSGDAVAKCDFTLPEGSVIPAGGALFCAKDAFWPTGKITDGNVDMALFDRAGGIVQRLYFTTKWTDDVFRMCDGKGGAFVATAFGEEVLNESDWRPSIPDIDDKPTRQAVSAAITATPAVQGWLARLAECEAGAQAIAAFRGDAATLTACYLVDVEPESNPEIGLRIPSFGMAPDGRLVIGGELLLHGVPSARTVNGTIKLLRAGEPGAEPEEVRDLGHLFPIPASSGTLERPDGPRHFFRLLVE